MTGSHEPFGTLATEGPGALQCNLLIQPPKCQLVIEHVTIKSFLINDLKCSPPLENDYKFQGYNQNWLSQEDLGCLSSYTSVRVVL